MNPFEDLATDDTKTELAMDNMAKEDDKRVETSSPLVLETWGIVNSNQCQTQKTKGGGKEAKVEANAYNEEAKQSRTVHDMGKVG